MGAMDIRIVPTTPWDDQKPGTSGLRKKTRIFRTRPHYVENFVQSVLDVVGEVAGRTFVLGGDGRDFCDEALRRTLAVLVGNRAGRVLVGERGLFSTPAVSCVIRTHGARGGFILTASHNPGGPDGDFGIKYNVENGGPAPESLTRRIHARTREIDRYCTVDLPADLDLSRPHRRRIAETEVQVVDPVADYAAMLEGLFDFEAIRRLLAGDFRMAFDALHGVTGLYARRILEERLGAPAGTVRHGEVLPDFGGLHPDPNLTWCRPLVREVVEEGRLDFAAACDGDGDRNMILGRGIFVSPCDSIAVLADRADLAPGYRGRVRGVARSMPTSRALDRVAAARGLRLFETPTGWKFFGDLLDAGLVQLCGEESFGTGSDHVREKDGLWAVLFWLQLLATTGEGVADILRTHWRTYGRDWFTRHDYEGLDPAAAEALLADLRGRLDRLEGTLCHGARIVRAEDFAYRDPLTGELVPHQGLRFLFDDDSRITLRLSGTGTEGAILRIYHERYGREDLERDPQQALAGPVARARALFELERRFGRSTPDVVT